VQQKNFQQFGRFKLKNQDLSLTDKKYFLQDLKLDTHYSLLNDPLLNGLAKLKQLKEQTSITQKQTEDQKAEEIVTFLLGDFEDSSLL